MAMCKHCGANCDPVELDEDTLTEIDFHGVECLTEVNQAVYEGVDLCEDCYAKEGGII